MLKQEKIPYQHNNVQFEGYLAFDDKIPGRQPVILIAHAWRGQTDFEREKAEKLTDLGYAAFALDVYGKGIEAKNDDEAQKLMGPLFLDRQLLRDRVLAGIEAIKNHPLIDPNNIGAIGFCFGGLTVVELAKSGANVKGVVSFHGVFASQRGEYKAKLAPTSDNIKAKVLVLQGDQDPFVDEGDKKAFEKEMSQRKVDWQWHTYGNTMHSFTNPNVDKPESGMQYNAQSDKRSWRSMRNFFAELFEGEGRGV